MACENPLFHFFFAGGHNGQGHNFLGGGGQWCPKV